MSQRIERRAKPFPQDVEEFRGQILVVEIFLPRGRQASSDIPRQRLGWGLVLSEEPEGLDVEHESVGRAFHPQVGVSLRGQTVVRAVYFDHGELGRVVTEPRLRRVDVGRIEASGFNERLLRPGGGADKDTGHVSKIVLIGPGGRPCGTTEPWIPPDVIQRLGDDGQNTTSRGCSCAILRQKPPLQSMTTTNCQSSDVAAITASTIFRPQPLTADVRA